MPRLACDVFQLCKMPRPIASPLLQVNTTLPDFIPDTKLIFPTGNWRHNAHCRQPSYLSQLADETIYSERVQKWFQIPSSAGPSRYIRQRLGFPAPSLFRAAIEFTNIESYSIRFDRSSRRYTTYLQPTFFSTIATTETIKLIRHTFPRTSI